MILLRAPSDASWFRGDVDRPFRGMCQAIEDQVQDMLIGQIVKNVFPVAPPADDIVCP